MKRIEDFEWNDILLGELFDFNKGNQNNMSSTQEGKIPLVSAKKCDNGYKTFISDNGKKLYDGHCITLNNDGDGGAGLAYYQPTKMALDSHVTALIPKVPMSRHTMLFIAKCISMQRSLFGHGRSINAARLRIFRLMLPMDKNGQPCYSFMDAYMKAVEKRLLTQYGTYLTQVHRAELNGGGNFEMTKWKAYSLNEICEIKSGVRLVSKQMINGKRPFIGAADSNNGVTNFVSNTNASLDSNVLGVNYNGNGVAIGFYHPYEAIFTDDVKRIKFKEHDGNKYVYLFLKAAILKQKSKYQYGYKFSGERMNRQKITLPSTADGKPDFNYMESYMRQREINLLNVYINKRMRKL
jgi:hypothetical protein